MADIAMCLNRQCPKFSACYRAQAEASRWQSFSNFSYEVGVNGVVCESFIPVHTLRQTTNSKTISRKLYRNGES